MSAATEFAPVVFIPERARGWDRRPLADVIELHQPQPEAVAPPLRLTRRGMAALAVVTAVSSALLVWVAWLSAPAATHSPAAPATVTVQSGDTLWSIAGRVAPNRDPRVEVADLQKVNHLNGAGLAAGQVLRTS